MTNYPWHGAAQEMPDSAFDDAAKELGCEAAVIQAIWMVESSGKPFLADGSLTRRFAPHHFDKRHWATIGFDPAGRAPWKASLAIKTSTRELMLETAYRIDPERACYATSYGGPQIMGFNAKEAGFASAYAMVVAMADSEEDQLLAFVKLFRSWGLDAAARAHDFRAIENRYNGGGFNGKYARKMEAEYRRLTGKQSPEVLRIGSNGASVRKLQAAIGIEADGAFGPNTDRAVRAFQREAGLPVDGLVGKRTWDALETKPGAQPVPLDSLLEKGTDLATKVGGGTVLGGALTKAVERAPDGVVSLMWYGGAAVVFAALCFALLVVARKVWRQR